MFTQADSLIFTTELLVVTVLGLVLGSFANALIYRVPRSIPWAFARGEKTSKLRSACPSCEAVLGIPDLVPLFSWLCLRGKCRHCKAPISMRYPLVEIGVLLVCLGTYGAFGFTGEAFLVIAAIPFLAALLVIDLEHMILPNQLVLIVGAIGLFRLGFFVFEGRGLESVLMSYVLGAVVFAVLSWFLGWFLTKILKKDALGFGDVKFFAVAGLWLGLLDISLFCILSGIIGIILALMWRMTKKEPVFPFGPALITSFYVLLLLEGSLLG